MIKTYQVSIEALLCRVTPLHKAASYEQRKTNLGNLNFWRRIIT